MADLQDDVSTELVWDLRALEAAESVSEECARNAGVLGGARAMMPSLHLNLGEAFRKLGHPNKARAHLELGRAEAPALSDDGYGRMIRGGLDRLEERLSGG